MRRHTQSVDGLYESSLRRAACLRTKERKNDRQPHSVDQQNRRGFQSCRSQLGTQQIELRRKRIVVLLNKERGSCANGLVDFRIIAV